MQTTGSPIYQGESTSSDDDGILLALARHQLRRTQGIPTLSVLAGPPARARECWRRWTAAAGWPVVEKTWPSESASSDENSDAASSGRPVPAACLYVPSLGESVVEDGTRVGNAGSAGSVVAAVRRLCAQLESFGPSQWTGGTVGLALEASDAAAFLRDAPEDRAKTFFREGLITLDSAPRVVAPTDGLAPRVGGLTAEVETVRLEASRKNARLARETFADTAWLLTRQGASERTFASFQTAALALREAAGGPGAAGAVKAAGGNPEAREGVARSAAEQFLFDLLAELPETSGLFALNVKLDFCFGPMRAEVDLLAAGLKLAVELDGYHHFKDADHYRRDRRKDALLQKQGYLVLRFLAEDVVARLEEILREIRAAVAFRRVTASGT